MLARLSALAFLALALPASAQAVDGATARAQTFAPDKTAVALSGALSEKDKGIIRRLVPLFAERLGTPMRYYGAIAYSPGDGLVSESLQSAVQYHSAAAADAAALSACAAASTAGGCQIAARILPQGFQPRDFTLSAEATRALGKEYGRGGGPKAMAASRSSGEWAVAKGQGARSQAVADCNAKARAKGAEDCALVVVD